MQLKGHTLEHDRSLLKRNLFGCRRRWTEPILRDDFGQAQLHHLIGKAQAETIARTTAKGDVSVWFHLIIEKSFRSKDVRLGMVIGMVMERKAWNLNQSPLVDWDTTQ